jgi:phosphatidylinositol glycan class N
LRNYSTLAEGLHLSLKNGIVRFISVLAVAGLFLEALVYSFFYREVLSAIFVIISAWPLIIPSQVRSGNKLLLAGWSLSCLCSSVFTLLPVEKGEDVTLV